MWTNIFLRLFLKIVASGKKGGHNSSVLCGWMKTKDLLCKTIHTTSHGNAPFPKKLQAAAVSRFVDCPRSVVIAMIRCCHLTHPPRLSHCSCFLSIYGVPFVFMWTDQCNVDTDLCTSINVKGNMMSFRCCEHWNREVKSWLCDALFGGSTKRCYKVTEPCFVWCMLKCHTSWGGGLLSRGSSSLTRFVMVCCRHEGRTWYTAHRGRLWIASTSKPPSPEEIKNVQEQYVHFYNGNFISCPSVKKKF